MPSKAIRPLGLVFCTLAMFFLELYRLMNWTLKLFLLQHRDTSENTSV